MVCEDPILLAQPSIGCILCFQLSDSGETEKLLTSFRRLHYLRKEENKGTVTQSILPSKK
jgi:hypothetical protein